jgi:exonuclease SbcC
MRLLRLKLEGYKSYASCELDLSGIQMCSIVGRNGSGKSSLAEAIIWVLFGYSKLYNRDLMHPGASQIHVELDFVIDDKEFHLTRTYKDSTLQATASVNGDSIPQYGISMSPELMKAIGTNRELLAESIMINQGQLSSFITATPSQRRDLIMSMLGLNRYNKAHEIARQSVQTMTATISSHGQVLDSNRKRLEAMPPMLEINTRLELLDIQSKEAAAKVTNAAVSIAAMKAKEDQIKEAVAADRKKIADLATAKDKTCKQLGEDIKAVEGANREAEELINQEPTATTQVDALTVELNEAHVALESIQRTRDRIDGINKSIEDQRSKLVLAHESKGNCPVCQSPLDERRWHAIISSMEEHLSLLTNELTNAQVALQKIQVPRRLPVITAALDEMKGVLVKIMSLKEHHPALRTELEKLQGRRDAVLAAYEEDVKRVNEEIDSLSQQVNVELGRLEEELRQAQDVANSLSGQLTDLLSTKKTRELLEHQITDATANYNTAKNKMAELEFVADALSPQGIPLMIIDHYLPIIESKASELLQRMSDGQLEMKILVMDGKKVELLAGAEGALRNVRGLSGGEQTRVGLAIRLALSQVLFEMTGCRFDCLIVDEPEYLDESGVAQFIEMVSSLHEVFPQIFVISHLPQIKSGFPQYIAVEKIEGVSTAELIP